MQQKLGYVDAGEVSADYDMELWDLMCSLRAFVETPMAMCGLTL